MVRAVGSMRKHYLMLGKKEKILSTYRASIQR